MGSLVVYLGLAPYDTSLSTNLSEMCKTRLHSVIWLKMVGSLIYVLGGLLKDSYSMPLMESVHVFIHLIQN
jgi:hypothetical protein